MNLLGEFVKSTAWLATVSLIAVVVLSACGDETSPETADTPSGPPIVEQLAESPTAAPIPTSTPTLTPTPEPTSTPTPEPIPTSTPEPTPTPTPEPTSTPTPEPIPTSTPEPTPTPTPEPTSTPTPEPIPTSTPEPTPTPTHEPTPTPTPEPIPTSTPEPTPTSTPEPTPTPTSEPTSTPTPTPPIEVSGSGTDVRFVEFTEGRLVVETIVSNNGAYSGIEIKVGGKYVVSASAEEVSSVDEWSSRSLITIGDDAGYVRLSPGRHPVEVTVGPDVSWSLRFVGPPPASNPEAPISGQGEDVRFVELTEGDWLVEIEISQEEYNHITVIIGGKSVVLEFDQGWTGKHLVSVGHSYDQIPPGNTAIEVDVILDALWTLQFMMP